VIELAKRAVAYKHWRWVAGMKLLSDDPCERIGYKWTDYDEEPVPVLDTGNGWGWPTVGSGWLPDLTDPATLGCLLHLVREAWDTRDCLVCVCSFEVRVCSRKDPVVILLFEDHQDLAANLVDALEAAP